MRRRASLSAVSSLLVFLAGVISAATAQDIFVTPVPNAPLSAVVTIERTFIQRNGATATFRSMSEIGRDSSGRIHNERRRLVPNNSTPELEHVHLHLHTPQVSPAHEHAHPLRFGLRPYAIGLVHGVAGSGGLALLVMATAQTATQGFLYMAALALGALAGMGILSALLTVPVAALRARYETVHLRFQFLSGVGSVAFGLWLFSEHLAEFL